MIHDIDSQPDIKHSLNLSAVRLQTLIQLLNTYRYVTEIKSLLNAEIYRHNYFTGSNKVSTQHCEKC